MLKYINKENMKPEITYNDFVKLDMRVAKVIAAEEIEGADKLLKITLDVGPEIGERTVAAGIKEWYSPKDLIGKIVAYLANLEPRKLRGVVSQGMIVAAGEETATLLQPDGDVALGEIIQ
jgi:methionyl-tRNA synthetase